MTQPQNLWEYYQQQGKPLPSIKERAPLFEQFGLGKTAEYIGTEQQNIALLGVLQKSKEPITSSFGKSPEDLTKAIEGITSPIETPITTPIVGISEAERIKKRAEAIKEGFGLSKEPISPTFFGEQDKTRLKTAQTERDVIQIRSEEILAEKLKLQEEWRNFQKRAGEGVTEAGRIGITTEEGRKIQEQLDVLNREELVIETKLRNRNSVISELMNVQRQDYQDAVSQYNTQFSQAIQLYSLFDKEDDELKLNAKASLDVLSKTYKAQIEAGQLTPNKITTIQQAKIEEYETQAELPLGSTMAVLQTLKTGEEKLYSGIDDAGNFVYITKDNTGKISTRVAKGVAVKKGKITLEGAYTLPDNSVFIPRTNLTTKEREKVQVIQTGSSLIQQVKDLYYDAVGSEYEGLGAGVISRFKGLQRWAGYITGVGSEKFNSYTRFLDSNRASIAKGIKGEVGNLAQNEQINALKSFPSRFSSPYEAAKSFELIEQQMKDQLETLGNVSDEVLKESSDFIAD